MKDTILIYYPYSLKENLNVGSVIRPTKMLGNFRTFAEENNFRLLFISGEQKERKKQLKEVKENIQNISYCYVENQNIPLLFSDDNHLPSSPFIDKKFFKLLKQNNIPIGLFYRDIYWKFDDFYKLPFIKKHTLRFFHKLDLSLYKKYIDILFLPSMEMNKYVGFNPERALPLPPGNDVRDIKRTPLESKTVYNAIYAGSLHLTSGVDVLLNSLEYFNSNPNNLNKIYITIICRKNDLKNFKNLYEPFIDKEWVQFLHKQSDEISDIYTESDFAVLPYRMNKYNDFAMPTKLPEYISYGLPVLSTNCKVFKRFINENKCGITVDDNIKSYNEGFSKMLNLLSQNKNIHQEIYNTFSENHTWRNRVITIDDTLRNYTKYKK